MALFFVELLVRGTLLCLLIALALRLLRHAAATYRHLLCTLALGGLLTLPLVQELLPPLPLLKADKPVVVEAIPPVPQRFEPIPQPLPSEQGRGEDPPKPSLPQGGWLGAKNEQRAGWVQPGGFEAYGLLAWALGATFLLLRLTVALVRLRQLAKRSQRTSLLETEILVSEHITTPLTWGVRRPVILLPTALLTGDPAVAQSALRHEKAHIARRDWLWHLLAEVVCAICWFQPGAWWLRRRLRAESERACDDRVLLSGVSGPDYAAHLLEILKVGRASALAPGMAAVGSMEARVKHILDPKKPRRAHGLRLALTAALGLVLLPLASLKVAAKPGERSTSRLQEAVELLAPKLTFLTPSALLAQAKATLVAPKPLEPMPLVEPTLAQPNGTLAMPQPIVPPQGSPAAEPPHPDSTIPLDKVVWGMIVDGLEPGFLLTGVTLIEDRLGTTKIGYTALLRNRTKQPITFLVRLLQYDGYDVPFTQDDSAKIPDTERARGVQHAGVGLDAVYQVTLAPGESVLVPGQEAHHNLQVLIGSGDGGKSPYFAKLKGGMDMLVQPLTVYRSPDMTKLPLHLTKCSLTKMSLDGTLHTEGAINVSMPDSGGTQLEAKLWLPKILGTSKTLTAPAASEPSGRVLPLDKVIWNEAVDGLAAGFLLTSSPRVPLNSKLTYQTLVRNTSNKPISFLTRLLQYDGYEAPTVEGKPTKGAKRGYPLDPLYSVTLAPGESVIVPAQNGRESLAISLGEGGSSDSPSLSDFTPGHLKIVQPVTIYRSPENLKLAEMMGIYTLSKVSREGRVRTEGANRATGLGGGTGRIEGGQTLEAYIYLEIGTRNAEAERNARAVVWGKVGDKGLQCGISLTSGNRLSLHHRVQAELFYRNVGQIPLEVDVRGAGNLALILHDRNGKMISLDNGTREWLPEKKRILMPGQVCSLGLASLTLGPNTDSDFQGGNHYNVFIKPDSYQLAGFQPGSNTSGFVEVKVVDEDTTSWGAVGNGLRLGLCLPEGLATFSKLSRARFEVLLQNTSDKPLSASWVTPARFEFYGPDLFTKEGEPIPYIKTLAGPYRDIGRELAPGESVVLGTITIPKEVQEHWDSLPQGPYLASGPPPPSPYEARFSLGVTVAGKGEQMLSARLPFTVSRRR